MIVADYKTDTTREATREEIASFVYFAVDRQQRDRTGWIVPIPDPRAQADRLALAIRRQVNALPGGRQPSYRRAAK